VNYEQVPPPNPKSTKSTTVVATPARCLCSSEGHKSCQKSTKKSIKNPAQKTPKK